MIELPRAAIRAHVIAESAEFFSFGTNDLTQTTFGISRDDAAPFLETYRQKGIIEQDPFVSLDIDGVGELVRMAAEKGRATRPGIKLGICGEHGGDPASIRFCEEVGLDYVSCSPFRVPIARLAAAQAAVRGRVRDDLRVLVIVAHLIVSTWRRRLTEPLKSICTDCHATPDRRPTRCRAICSRIALRSIESRARIRAVRLLPSQSVTLIMP